MAIKLGNKFNIKLFKNTKFITKLLISYLLLIFVSMGLMATFSYKTLSQALKDKTTYSAIQSFEQSYSYLSYKLYNVFNQSKQIAENLELRTIASKTPDDYIDNHLSLVKDTKTLTTYLQEKEDNVNIKRVRLYIDDALSLSANKLNIFSIKDIESAYWYKILSNNNSRSLWLPSLYLSGDETKLIATDLLAGETLSFSMKALHPFDYNKSVGYIRCDFPRKAIEDILSNANSISDSISYIMNGDGVIVAQSSNSWDDNYRIPLKEVTYYKTDWNNQTIINETSLVGSRKIKDTDWYMVTIIPYGQIANESNRIFKYLFLIMFAILSFVYITAYFVSRSITKPVLQLTEKMNDLRGGKLSPMTPSESRDEIGILIDDYNFMTERMSELIEAQYKSGQELKSAELKALQAQINPHFLYNTLDMINWYGKKSNSQEILSIVAALTKFYRLSLSKGQDTVSIADEIEHVKSYFTIQNLRFENKLSLVVDIPENLLQYSILKITLQPLVENSVLHGIMCKETKSGTVKISGTIDNNIIILVLKDDGVGIPPDKQTMLFTKDLSKHKGGFGVRNVDERIKIFYGNDFGLSYESIEGEGTTVFIKIPAR
jgi:two-component system sensor histidine kinase YesM